MKCRYVFNFRLASSRLILSRLILSDTCVDLNDNRQRILNGLKHTMSTGRQIPCGICACRTRVLLAIILFLACYTD
jgi:hypothetical protein